AEPAPRGADAALHVAQRLAVRLARFEPGVDQLAPDVRQLLEARAEHVDALAARDLRVEAVLGRDRGDDPELLRSDLAARDARNHRIGAVLLHVRERAVVGVLQRPASAVERVAAVLAGQDGSDGRLADVAPASGAQLG